jgi:hypothetical protein
MKPKEVATQRQFRVERRPRSVLCSMISSIAARLLYCLDVLLILIRYCAGAWELAIHRSLLQDHFAVATRASQGIGRDRVDAHRARRAVPLVRDFKGFDTYFTMYPARDCARRGR